MAMPMDQADITTTNSQLKDSKAIAISEQRKRVRDRRLTFFGLLVGYGSYYLCRQNFSVALVPMKTALGLDTVALGLVSSVGTLAYAIGKVLTGAAADQRGGRWAFLVGLFGSAIATIAFGFSSALWLLGVTWVLNRFFQSMGWGGLVQLVGSWYPKRQYGTAMGLISTSYQGGGVVATLFAAWILSLSFEQDSSWRFLFWMPAIVLLMVGVGCFFALKTPPEGLHAAEDDLVENIEAANVVAHTGFAKYRWLLGNRRFLLVCALSFSLTLLRECFSFWLPAFFVSLGSSTAQAAFHSAVFPILGVAGTLAAGWISDRKFPGRRPVVVVGMLIGLLMSLWAASNVGVLAQCASVSEILMAFVLLGFCGFFLLGPYSMVGGVFALDYGGRNMAGTAAGLLDGFGYLGASAAGLGVALVVNLYGWTGAFRVMTVFAAISIVLCLILVRSTRSRKVFTENA